MNAGAIMIIVYIAGVFAMFYGAIAGTRRIAWAGLLLMAVGFIGGLFGGPALSSRSDNARATIAAATQEAEVNELERAAATAAAAVKGGDE